MFGALQIKNILQVYVCSFAIEVGFSNLCFKLYTSRALLICVYSTLQTHLKFCTFNKEVLIYIYNFVDLLRVL